LPEVLLLACAVVLCKLIEHYGAYRWCWHLGHWQLSHVTVPKRSLDMPSTVSTCRTSWKMHFVVIFQMFAFRGVHSNHFSLHFQFHFVTIFLPNKKNDPKMELKMSRKWSENGYREQP
jgi:hypothetical protein